MKNRKCSCSRGKGLGGTTLTNGLVYSRGHKSDYEKLAEVVGDERWNYSLVLNYFKKSENFVHNDPDPPYEPEYDGTEGNLRVECHHPKSSQLLAFLEVNKESRVVVGGINCFVKGQKEVILSAGGFGSPQVLMLSDDEDRDINVLYEGVQLVLNLLETEAFMFMGAKLQGGPLRAYNCHEYLCKEYWFCALRQLTQSLHHPVGTCPMGKNPNKGAVIDPNLKVSGVADASVFPVTFACHTNAPAVMVDEQLGDIVKKTYIK